MNSTTITSKLTPALLAQLDALASSNHTGASSLTEQLNAICLTARLTSVDRLACEVELIAVSAPHDRDLSLARMRELADRLVSELFYLEERLVVVEIDQVTPEIQLRSEAPRRAEEARTYFEVQVGKKDVSLRRFEKQPGRERKLVPATLTRDTFCRLCVDLVSAVHQ